jgi:hypothetical protein
MAGGFAHYDMALTGARLVSRTLTRADIMQGSRGMLFYQQLEVNSTRRFGKRRWRVAVLALAGVAVVMLGAMPAGQAQGWRHYHGWHPQRWHTGHWHHGWHNGRFGWWWAAPGLAWAFYTAPVYPYPPLPVPVAAPAGPPPAPGMWYWCPRPHGYYPYVHHCRLPWQPVPAG